MILAELLNIRLTGVYNLHTVLSALAGITVLIGLFRYGLTVQKKQTDSTIASWVIWLALDAVALIGMMKANTANGQLVGTVIGEVYVVLAVLRHSKRGWALIDKICVCLGGIGLTIIVFGDPALGIVTTLIAVFIGAIPTFISAHEQPEREDKVSWIIFWISCVFEVTATILHLCEEKRSLLTLEAMAQPLIFALIETIMLYLLLVRPRLRNQAVRKAAIY